MLTDASSSRRRFQDRFVAPTKWFRAYKRPRTAGTVPLISSCKRRLIEVLSRPEAVPRLVELELRGKSMSIIGSIETTRELCANPDNLIQLTKESRVPIRALSFIEQAEKICRPTSTRSSKR